MGFKLKQLFCFHEYEKILFRKGILTNRLFKTKEEIECLVCFKCRKCGKLKYFFHDLIEKKDKLEFKQEVREQLEEVEI